MEIAEIRKIIIVFMFLAILVKALEKALDKKLVKSKNAWKGKMPFHNIPILTKPEYKFYLALKPIMDERGYLICPKVRLKDMFEINSGEKNRMKYFGQISQKHVDFLICDSKLNPLFAIELDDISHNRNNVKRKDSFKDQLFKQRSNYPLYRVKTKTSYSKEYIETSLHLKVEGNKSEADCKDVINQN